MAKSKQQRQREANTARIQRELKQTEGKLKGSLLKAKITPLKQALANKAETKARLARERNKKKAAVNTSQKKMLDAKAKVATATKNRDRLRRKSLLLEAQKGHRKAGEHAAANVKKHSRKELAAKVISAAGYVVPVGGAARVGYAAGKALLSGGAKKIGKFAGSKFIKRSSDALGKQTAKKRTPDLTPSQIERLRKKVREVYPRKGMSKPRSMKKTASDANTKADRKSLGIKGSSAKKNVRKSSATRDPHPGAPISSNLKTGARKKKRYDTKGREY